MNKNQLQLHEIEQIVCDIASEQLVIQRDQIHPNDRLIEDLKCDSLDLVELLMELEDHFNVTIPHDSDEPVYKSVFVRLPFRLSDLAEAIYLQLGTGKSIRENWTSKRDELPESSSVPFTQLNGRWDDLKNHLRLYEELDTGSSFQQFRRRSDGMRSILIPADEVEIGSDIPDSFKDEKPQHSVQVDEFLIDAETVSTTAYCRFLNSLRNVGTNMLSDWFVLDEQDDRIEQQLIHETDGEWRPVPGTEKQPMILVSWYGANAYSLWANDTNWKNYKDNIDGESHSFLPTEAQWEYAARGKTYREYPWGSSDPKQEKMRFGRHQISASYANDNIPMANVNDLLGISPFGLQHVSGNVWEWCRDWYESEFYQQSEATVQNAVNLKETGIRSERGGSWVGPAELCRCSYRRGREPNARGRCLGFRCISYVP